MNGGDDEAFTNYHLWLDDNQDGLVTKEEFEKFYLEMKTDKASLF